MSAPYLESRSPHLLLHIKVVPNSSRTQLAGTLGNALKIKIAQPPEDGKANKAVIEFFADLLDLRKNQIILLTGHTNPEKTLQLPNLPHILQKLSAAVKQNS
jgi:uncharacterized protein